ncbi:DNA-binding protein [Escherichia coli]|nr:DNA-binding protein [Escherichia coli]
MNNLMTTKQVADFCGVSVSTVLRWNSVNRRTGQKYRPDFPDPDIKSCPNKWASRKIYKFAGVIEECEAAQIEMTHPIAHS